MEFESIEIASYLAAALGLLAYLPQTIKTIRTKQTKDLSLATFAAICISAALWTAYGFGKAAPAIWFTNLVIGSCTLIIVKLIIQGRNKAKKEPEAPRP